MAKFGNYWGINFDESSTYPADFDVWDGITGCEPCNASLSKATLRY